MPNPDPIEQPQENVIYINYFDQIEMERIKFLMAICTELLEKHKPTTLYFSFASGGGSVDAGIALYEYLVGLPVNIVMHNIGAIDSIANVIFAAGNKRYASPHSTFLFHGVKFEFSAPTSFSQAQLEEMLSIIEGSHKKIAKIVCEKSAFTKKEVEKLFHSGKVIDADTALKKKFIDEIKTLEIPKDAGLISINFTAK